MVGLPLWVVVTVAAAAAQTGRNALQHRLTAVLGTAGATQVRFLYGLPFALLFLAAVAVADGPPPAPGGAFLGFVLGGAVAQILATALMLAAMRTRAFALAVAYTKTEPLQVAVFGLLVLGDAVTPWAAAAIGLATAGIFAMSWKPAPAAPAPASGSGAAPPGRYGAALLGVASGAFFALAAVGLRGAILALPDGSFLVRATTTLAWTLATQTALLLAWLALFDRPALLGSLRIWRDSLAAGFLGALASQCWFLGFALTSAANVRTLGLVEVLFAAVLSRRLFAQAIAPREAAGMALLVAGVALLLAGG